MSAALEADHLTAGYAQPVVRGLTWTANEGEVWAVLGPNGAGKSTLLKSCLGLLRPSSGAVRILGRDVHAWPRRELAQRLAWVPQQLSSEAGFTSLEVVLMGRSPHLGNWGIPSRADNERAMGALDALGISALAPRRTFELSGGEQRLVWLARALAQSPNVLLLDEPTAFLDIHHQVEALACLKKRAQEGLCVVAVLHDVNLAAAFADHALLVKDGVALASGPAAEVLSQERVEALYGTPMTRVKDAAGQSLFAPRWSR